MDEQDYVQKKGFPHWFRGMNLDFSAAMGQQQDWELQASYDVGQLASLLHFRLKFPTFFCEFF